MKIEISTIELSKRIHTLREVQVMLDSDLAEIYGVETRTLKQAVKRNLKRFPSNFMFELTRAEFENLRSQSVISSSLNADTRLILRSQSVISSSQDPFRHHGGSRYTPFAFSESGVAMLSTVLNSQKAIEVNIEIMTAFVQFRKQTKTNIESFESKLDLILQKLDGLKLESSTSISTEPDQVTLIQNTVAKYYGVKTEVLKSPVRSKAISFARQVAIYLIRKQTQMSFTEIGWHFGQRDHSTILQAYHKIKTISDIDNLLQETLGLLMGDSRPTSFPTANAKGTNVSIHFADVTKDTP